MRIRKYHENHSPVEAEHPAEALHPAEAEHPAEVQHGHIQRFRPTRRAIIATTLAASAAASGIGLAATTLTASASGRAASTGTKAKAPHAAKAVKELNALLGRADYATVELKVKGSWVSYELDRGKVSSISSTSVTVARPDGQSATEAISSTTKFSGLSQTSIAVGDPISVISTGGTALRIRAHQIAASSS